LHSTHFAGPLSERVPDSPRSLECDDRGLLDEWIAAWIDLVEFDVIPVITFAEAAARVPSGDE